MLKILNESPGFGAPLSKHEINDFLKSLHLETVDENGRANIHPVGYQDPSDNKYPNGKRVEENT